ncbi:MAG: NUDIX hydrolase [Spirochaetaceae bacterium]|nr:NUDIX hydrolase [Spirochaetaceae bacterium]
MNENKLVWSVQNQKKVFSCPVFSVRDIVSLSPGGDRAHFSVIDAADWAIIIPLLEKDGRKYFVMVRQWRHGTQTISLEFPGGVIERGEDPLAGARRELLEETGYSAGKIQKLGELSPNPAIMSNRVHFFMGTELVDSGKQSLDEDEFVEIELTPEEEVIRAIGQPPYVHALMASALSFYLGGRGL